MDPVTQGTLGAALSQSTARSASLRAAGALGVAAGMAPDLDVLITSANDPLLFLEYHRQFTHALVFIPFGALLVAGVLYPFTRRWLSWREAYLACLAGYATHGLLDACTSYGTQLFWPFSTARVAWNSVSVVDPLFTLPLLALVGFAAWRQRRVFAWLGLAWALGYMALGVVQHQRALDAASTVARGLGHEPRQLTVKPGFGNLLLWKVVYEHAGRYHVNALRMTRSPTWCVGASVAKLEIGRDLLELQQDSQQARDLERFRWFSADYLALDGAGRVMDVRYSNVPNQIAPLWGIGFAFPAERDAHVDVWWQRRVTGEQRRALLDLLAGRGCVPLEDPSLMLAHSGH